MNVRLKALQHAQANIGVSEHPPGSNSGPSVDGWLRTAKASSPNPWCAAFAYSMKVAAGSKAAKKIRYPASVLSWVEAADKNGWRVQRPFRGDDVAYSWDGHDPSPDDHIGTVEKVLALPRSSRPVSLRGKWFIRVVEGNSNNRVERRWRWVDPLTVAFIRIPD